MIFEARKASRRCSNVTLVANRARNIASSIAESPPPTTATSLSRKKNPSHVAQLETPCPISACSLGNPSQRALAPEAMMSVRVSTSPFEVCSLMGRAPNSTEFS